MIGSLTWSDMGSQLYGNLVDLGAVVLYCPYILDHMYLTCRQAAKPQSTVSNAAAFNPLPQVNIDPPLSFLE